MYYAHLPVLCTFTGIMHIYRYYAHLPVLYTFTGIMHIYRYYSHLPVLWLSGRASTLQMVGRGFEPRPSHTNDFKIGTHCLLVWRSTYENGVGNLSLRSYHWTSPTLYLSLHSQTCGLGLLETEMGAALCTIGAGGTLTFDYAHSFQGSNFLYILQCSFDGATTRLQISRYGQVSQGACQYVLGTVSDVFLVENCSLNYTVSCYKSRICLTKN